MVLRKTFEMFIFFFIYCVLKLCAVFNDYQFFELLYRVYFNFKNGFYLNFIE